jgi:transposase-like protein
LIIDINELGYCGTGRKYNVADNTIKKWLKIYGCEDTSKIQKSRNIIFENKTEYLTEKQIEYSKRVRKIKERPSYEQLITNVNELGYCGTGRKYNVNSNTIKSWLKWYIKYENK